MPTFEIRRKPDGEVLEVLNSDNSCNPYEPNDRCGACGECLIMQAEYYDMDIREVGISTERKRSNNV